MQTAIKNLPKHIGIIIDGNRRYAKKSKLKTEEGHKLGYKKIKELFDWCLEYKIKELTIYTFSLENFNRPKEEITYLMRLFEKAFNELKKDKRIKKIKINFIGKTRLFSKNIQKLMHELMKLTKDNKNLIIDFAMAYSGRSEIVDATKKILKKVKEGKMNIEKINEKSFRKFLYLHSYPDLIIRTSESRLSGFLTYQSTYSEIIFLPEKLWPELQKEDFIKCLKEYSKRERRFGK